MARLAISMIVTAVVKDFPCFRDFMKIDLFTPWQPSTIFEKTPGINSMNRKGSLEITSKQNIEKDAQGAPLREGALFVLTGPSGVGKGTIVVQLLQDIPKLKRSVSVTTRAKRPDEKEGVDYFYRSGEEFEQMRRDRKLLEWAEFAGCRYGTPKEWVLDQLRSGIDVILEIEVQGAKQISQRFPDAVLVFISPPSFEELEQRLRGRATETEEKIEERLKTARQELSEKQRFHYEVVNDNVEEAVKNLTHIVYAERCRIRDSNR
jgi:guanylate kinase